MIVRAGIMAVISIRASLRRTALAVLGIAIGSAAVIALVSVGRGSEARVRSAVAELGADLLTVTPGVSNRVTLTGTVPAPPLAASDVVAIGREIRAVRIAVGVASQPILATGPGATLTVNAIGTTSAYFDARRWRLAAGRLFTSYEEDIGKAVCVIGSGARARLLGRDRGVGETIRLRTLTCEVVGVLEPREGSAGLARSGEDDLVVALPLAAFQRRLQGRPDLGAIVVAGTAGGDVDRLRGRIERLMAERRGSVAGRADVQVQTMAEAARIDRGTGRTMAMLILAAALVSLVMGGVGIMNTMLSSLAERRREIGIRLAIGATPADVRLQVLAEAALLALLGGLIGLAFGLAGGALACAWLGLPFHVDVQVVIAALATTTVTGLVSGYGPAARAAGTDPITALRSI